MKPSTTSRVVLLALLAAIAVGAALLLRPAPSDDGTALLATSAPAPAPTIAEPAAPRGCLPTGDGFFRARLDGALQMRLDWANAQIQCEGMPRPDGNGIRLSFRREEEGSGPLLIVLGIAGLSESSTGHALPANVTIIEERTSRVFGTLGDDKCTVDELRQELLAPWRAEARRYRVSGRGFCIEPALAVGGERTVLMSTFDFAGQVMYETIGARRTVEGPV
jgi:hypothetical protein